MMSSAFVAGPDMHAAAAQNITVSSIDTRQCHFANGATENDTCILDHLNLLHLHVHFCLTTTFFHRV